MGRYINEIVQFISNFDEGLNLEKDDTLLIISNDEELVKAFKKQSNNTLSFSPENCIDNIIEIADKTLDYVIMDSSFNNLDAEILRKTFRTKLKNHYSDVIIIEDDLAVNPQKLEMFFAGSWYQKKEFAKENDSKLILYYNPPGFNSEELKSQKITEFIQACEDYCNVIENYKNYSIKDFLYNIQKCLVNYYLKGFYLPECCGCDNNTNDGFDEDIREQARFRFYLDSLSRFLADDDLYFSNFSPMPDGVSKDEVTRMSLACDLAEIYEDIKCNLIVYKTENIYNQQQAIWQFEFDWKGHTGDHWSFAVRAIHWKLQDLKYD